VLDATLAIARDNEGALALATELEKEFPSDTLVGRVWVAAARAAIELQRGNPTTAIALLEPARPYEFGRMTRMFGSLTPTYLRGRAYLDAKRFTDAATEFQKILDHRGVSAVSPVYALAHVELARALHGSGDPTKAAKLYQDFFALWSGADADIPFLQRARQEYTALQSSSPVPAAAGPGRTGATR
jgi:hypothetical protein